MIQVVEQKMLFYIIFFAVALIYSMVGLGGGTAYTAILTVYKTPYEVVPSTSLFLNTIVSLISFLNYRFHFPSERKFLISFIFLLGGGGAILGANLKLQEKTFFIILGLALVSSAILSLLQDFGMRERIKFKIHQNLLPFISFLVGFIAGITGIGGGIYLSPLLIFSGFPTKEIASITSLYIFLNSALGFSAKFLKGKFDFNFALPILFFVILGALIGSVLGSLKLKPKFIKFLLNLIILNIGGYSLWRGIT